VFLLFTISELSSDDAPVFYFLTWRSSIRSGASIMKGWFNSSKTLERCVGTFWKQQFRKFCSLADMWLG
jgi:hypothetical protein